MGEADHRLLIQAQSNYVPGFHPNPVIHASPVQNKNQIDGGIGRHRNFSGCQNIFHILIDADINPR
ncbi:hypothetical protein D3C75_994940 [compost metagenome]